MKYQEFLNNIETEITKRLDTDFQLYIQPFTRNNGTTYDGLVIFNPKLNISPTIYLNPYYHRYLDGVALEDIYDDIIKTYENHLPTDNFNTDFFTDYEKAKSTIVMKLINYEQNEELLDKVPHFKFLDFAIVFQSLLSRYNDGYATILIYHHHLDFWGVSEEELYDIAMKNTPKLLPYQLDNMNEFVKSFLEEVGQTDPTPDIPMYILSNTSKLNGATSILYEGLLANLAKSFKSDLILLPSSIHEFIIVPADSPEDIDLYSQMVNEVNETQLTDEEILADHAYYYSRESEQIYSPYAIATKIVC